MDGDELYTGRIKGVWSVSEIELVTCGVQEMETRWWGPFHSLQWRDGCVPSISWNEQRMSTEEMSGQQGATPMSYGYQAGD